MPWLALLVMAAIPVMGLARSWTLVLLAWGLFDWAQALADCPDGTGLRNAIPRRVARLRWSAWGLGLAGAVASLVTQGASDVEMAALGYALAWAAHLHALHIHRARLGAAEILSYSAGLLCVLLPVMIALHSASTWTFLPGALLAAALRVGAARLVALRPAASLRWARARRLVLASAVVAAALGLSAQTLVSMVGASAVWVVPLVLVAFGLGLRLPQVSRIFLPRAGARMAYFERARDATGAASHEALETVLEQLREAADTEKGPELRLAQDSWDEETFSFLGRFPFAIMSAGTLAQLSMRRPDLRPWLARMHKDEACAWVRLGRADAPVGVLVVPEAYAAGALCYEEICILHELGQRITQLIHEAKRSEESQAREHRGQSEAQTLRDELGTMHILSQRLMHLASEGQRMHTPLPFYARASTDFLRALEAFDAHQPGARLDVVLPPGVSLARLLLCTQSTWHVVQAQSHENPEWRRHWQAARAVFGRHCAVADAHLLSPQEQEELDATVYAFSSWAAPQGSETARLELPDLSGRPEDIEATILDELVCAGLAQFGQVLGANDAARAYLVELAHAEGEALLRATIRRAVCRLSSPRTLTRADV